MADEVKQTDIEIWGDFPDPEKDEEVFKFAEYYGNDDTGKCKAMIRLDGKYGKFFMLYADRNSDGNFVKLICNSTVNKMLLDKTKRNTEFTVPFEFRVGQLISQNKNEYTAIKIIRRA